MFFFPLFAPLPPPPPAPPVSPCSSSRAQPGQLRSPPTLPPPPHEAPPSAGGAAGALPSSSPPHASSEAPALGWEEARAFFQLAQKGAKVGPLKSRRMVARGPSVGPPLSSTWAREESPPSGAKAGPGEIPENASWGAWLTAPLNGGPQVGGLQTCLSVQQPAPSYPFLCPPEVSRKGVA